MIFRTKLSQNRQFRIISEYQAPNPIRNSRKLPHGNAKKRFFAPKCRAEWKYSSKVVPFGSFKLALL